VSFTQSMALEPVRSTISGSTRSAPDHTISPGTMGNPAGPVDESTWIQRSPEEVDALNRAIPLLREGVAEECGDAAVYLCSRMGEYVTGATLPIDGGTRAASGWLRGTDENWTLTRASSRRGEIGSELDQSRQ